MGCAEQQCSPVHRTVRTLDRFVSVPGDLSLVLGSRCRVSGQVEWWPLAGDGDGLQEGIHMSISILGQSGNTPLSVFLRTLTVTTSFTVTQTSTQNDQFGRCAMVVVIQGK